MTLEEYKEGLIKLDKAHSDGKKHLAKVYAASNNPFKKDSIVADVRGAIKITKVGIAYDKLDDYLPKCLYEGMALDLEGVPLNPVQVRTIWQPDMDEKYLPKNLEN